MSSERKIIDRFNIDYKFLSNFQASTFFYDGKRYATVEHAYQAMKSTDPIEQEKIRNAVSPSQAKKFGKNVQLRGDWENIKVDVMRELLEIKFQNPFLRHKLIATGDATLIEGNTWGDTYWGVCKGVGENVLGKLLMELRDKINEEEQTELKEWTVQSTKKL